jgi:hypothetical protein
VIKFSGAIAAGEFEDVAVTSLALTGVIYRGNVRVDMFEPSSGDPVPVVDGSQNYGSWAGYQVGGAVLRLTNIGSTAATATVEQ